jgi:cob(I)alamin adenosyltransferase
MKLVKQRNYGIIEFINTISLPSACNSTQPLKPGIGMALNKKQKKQLDVIRKKLTSLQQQLAGEKRQMDDPAAVERLEAEIAKFDEQRRKLDAQR